MTAEYAPFKKTSVQTTPTADLMKRAELFARNGFIEDLAKTFKTDITGTIPLTTRASLLRQAASGRSSQWAYLTFNTLIKPDTTEMIKTTGWATRLSLAMQK